MECSIRAHPWITKVMWKHNVISAFEWSSRQRRSLCAGNSTFSLLCVLRKWNEQGKILHQNSSAGIIMSNQSLVLQRIDRQTAGLYTCLATNMEGQGESNALALPVKCECLSSFFFNQNKIKNNNTKWAAQHPVAGQWMSRDPVARKFPLKYPAGMRSLSLLGRVFLKAKFNKRKAKMCVCLYVCADVLGAAVSDQ